jgi:hypothetical protein
MRAPSVSQNWVRNPAARRASGATANTSRPITKRNTTCATHRSTSATGSACHATPASPDGARRAAAAAAPAVVSSLSFLPPMPATTSGKLGHRQRNAVCRQANCLAGPQPSTQRALAPPQKPQPVRDWAVNLHATASMRQQGVRLRTLVSVNQAFARRNVGALALDGHSCRSAEGRTRGASARRVRVLSCCRSHRQRPQAKRGRVGYLSQKRRLGFLDAHCIGGREGLPCGPARHGWYVRALAGHTPRP